MPELSPSRRAEIEERWGLVPQGEQPLVTVTCSSRPGALLNAIRHAPEDVHALLAEVDRLRFRVGALTVLLEQAQRDASTALARTGGER